MKIRYKALKKKESVVSLIKKHDSAICMSLILTIVTIVISIGGYIVSKVEDVSFGLGILEFIAMIVGLFMLAFFLYVIANYVWRAITYIRIYFRYAYLPLTMNEAKAIGIDNSPVIFFKALKEMMCYYYYFDEIKKPIQDLETERKLTHLFYQLFFFKDENHTPLILEWLNNKEACAELRDSMKMIEKHQYFKDKEYALLKPLGGIFKVLNSLVVHNYEVMDIAAFTGDSIAFKAIMQCKDDTVETGCFFVFIGDDDIVSTTLLNCKTIDEAVKNINTVYSYLKM